MLQSVLLMVAWFLLGFCTSYAQKAWEWQRPLTTSNTFQAVQFADANNGFAVGDGGIILRTTDGGSLWVVQQSGIDNSLLGFRVGSTRIPCKPVVLSKQNVLLLCDNVGIIDQCEPKSFAHNTVMLS